MDVWALKRTSLPRDLLTVLAALGDLQYRYDWVISDTDIYYRPDTPQEVKERWGWTGLLMDGAELTRHLESGYLNLISGAFSAVPVGTRPEAVWNYLPGWEVDFCSPGYTFQTPLTQLELFCYDGYACVLVCPAAFSAGLRQMLPTALPAEEFFRR